MRARPPAPDAPLRRDVRLLGDVLGRVLVEQERRRAARDVEERIRALLAPCAAARLGEPAIGAPCARARRSSARPTCCAPSRSTSSSRTSPSSTTACAAGASTSTRGASPRESLAEAFERLERRRPERRAARRPPSSSRSSSCSRRTRPRRRGARSSRRTCGIAELPRRGSTTRRSPRSSAQRDRGRARRGDHRALADRRGARRSGRASSTRSGTASGSSRRACSTPARGAARASYRGRFPGAPPPFSFGSWIGGDQDGNPARRRRDDRGGARARARARARALPRRRCASSPPRSARAARSSASRDELDASIARDERELPSYAAEIGDANDDEPYRRKLSFMWRRLGDDDG